MSYIRFRNRLCRRGTFKFAFVLAVLCASFACDRQPAAPPAQLPAPAAPVKTPAVTKPTGGVPDIGPTAPVASAPAATPGATPAGASKDLADGIMAYYFHRTLRCATCLSIEKQAKEAIETGFSGELANRLISWRAVNIETPGDEHFQKDFEIERQTLMFVEMRDGKAARSAKLERVWDLVGDPVKFQDYIWTEMQAFIDAGGATTP